MPRLAPRGACLGFLLLALLRLSVAHAGEPPAPPPSAPVVSTAAATDALPSGELYVTADLPGGAVWLDGADTGRAAPVLLSALAPGEHAVEVRASCARAAATVSVAPGQIGRVELVLQTGTATLDVASEPNGATVLIDGAEVGVTPYTTDALTCGAHALVLRLPDHVDAAMSVDARAFERTTLTLPLQAITYGALVVAPVPLEADLELDGEAMGTGPRTFDRLPSGEHTVRVAAEGYVAQVLPVTITPDTTARLDVALQRPTERRSAVGRLALNGAVTAGGLALGGVAGWTYGRAAEAFDVYLETPSDARAATVYETQVAPLRTAALVQGAVAVALLGTATGLWLTTDLALTPAPGGVLLSGRW